VHHSNHHRNSPVLTGSFPATEWELPTLRESIHKGHVAKVAIHSTQMAVEVLDVNGIARRVQIFPDATPVLIEDMREAHVPFSVVPEKAPNPLAPLYASFCSTLLVIWVIGALGMMEQLIWGIAILGISVYSSLAEANRLIDRGLEWVDGRLTGRRRAQKQEQELEQDRMVPLPIEIDDPPDDGIVS